MVWFVAIGHEEHKVVVDDHPHRVVETGLGTHAVGVAHRLGDSRERADDARVRGDLADGALTESAT